MQDTTMNAVCGDSALESASPDKLPFLEMAQQIIARMANCSVTLKVCCSTLVAGMFVFLSPAAATGFPKAAALLAPFAICIAFFAYFDARYLCQERGYRLVYRRILEAQDGLFDRSLAMPKPEKQHGTTIDKCLRSWSVGGFYIAMLVGVCAAFISVAFCS